MHTVLQYIYTYINHAARNIHHSYEHCSTGRPNITALIAPAAKLASTLQVSSHSQPSLLLWVFGLTIQEGKIYAPEPPLQTGALC